MSKPEPKYLDLRDLSADELTRTLADYFQRVREAVDEDELEVGRELVRRARREEKLEEALARLLAELATDSSVRECCGPAVIVAVSLARVVLHDVKPRR